MTDDDDHDATPERVTPRGTSKRELKTADIGREFMTDKEAASMFSLGMTAWFEVQERPGFPKPFWLGPRMKRHVRAELVEWALKQRDKPDA